jgi:hypothetical protein
LSKPLNVLSIDGWIIIWKRKRKRKEHKSKSKWKIYSFDILLGYFHWNIEKKIIILSKIIFHFSQSNKIGGISYIDLYI